MIDRLRRRFILIAMCSVVLVLGITMAAINYGNYRSVDVEADAVLSMLRDNGGLFPKMEPKFHGPGERRFELSPEAPFQTRFFTVTVGADGELTAVNTGSIAAISSDDAAEYARTVLARGKTSGWEGQYKYLIDRGEDNSTVIFLDRSIELSSFRDFLGTSILVSLAALSAIFVLVLFFSGRAIRPVAESYEKQRRFITDAGHELKTPITVIDTSAEVLELEQGENKWTQSIRHQAARLASLTEDLISLSRIDENSRLIMVDFSLSDAVEESAEALKALLETKGRSLRMDIEPNISYKGSEQHIRQLVGILLDNASKYAVPDSEVVLTLKRQGKNAVLSCVNQADNLAPGDHREFFERFYRADASRNSEVGGHGIGLSIARAIVQNHKGKISAVSPDGRTLAVTAVF